MSYALICDGNECQTKLIVDESLLHIIPTGWTKMALEVGTGAANVPKKQKHLCPRCTGTYQFRQESREEPTPPKQLGKGGVK